jgi:NitT/TauT family transport system permease protein
MNKLKHLAPIIVLIIIWCIFSIYKNGTAGAKVIPDPLDTSKALVNILTTKKGLPILLPTLISIFKSIFVVLIIGVPISILFSYFGHIYLYVKKIFSFIGSIPPVILFPIFYYQVLNSNEELARIICVCFGCIPILVISIADKITSKSKERLEAVKLFGANSFFILKNIVLYELMTNIFSATKTALSFCIIIVIATELVAQNVGIGAKVIQLRNDYDYTNQFALIILIGFIGVILSTILSKIEKHIVKWKE